MTCPHEVRDISSVPKNEDMDIAIQKIMRMRTEWGHQNCSPWSSRTRTRIPSLILSPHLGLGAGQFFSIISCCFLSCSWNSAIKDSISSCGNNIALQNSIFEYYSMKFLYKINITNYYAHLCCHWDHDYRLKTLNTHSQFRKGWQKADKWKWSITQCWTNTKFLHGLFSTA